ncbi:MAG: helix-turn-helix domain-containing protein [Pseudobdellovibrionaceae bacterium]
MKNMTIESFEIVTVIEAAKMLGVSTQAIYVAIYKGLLFSERCTKNRKVMIKVVDLEAYKKSRWLRDNLKNDGELVFDQSKGIYSVTKTADFLGISESRIYREVNSGVLKAHKKGGFWVIHIDDIQNYQEKYLTRIEKEAI